MLKPEMQLSVLENMCLCRCRFGTVFSSLYADHAFPTMQNCKCSLNMVWTWYLILQLACFGFETERASLTKRKSTSFFLVDHTGWSMFYIITSPNVLSWSWNPSLLWQDYSEEEVWPYGVVGDRMNQQSKKWIAQLFLDTL